MIKSVSYSQDEILQWIIDLYCPDGFELDPTYAKGCFYKNLPQPKYKSDIKPQSEDVKKWNCCRIPLGCRSLQSIMFDPPFIGGSAKKLGIIQKRFGFYKSVPELWEMYQKAIKEFYRLLKPNGILVVKCQDVIESSKQYLSHVGIINLALSLGFYPKDLFILLAKHRMPQWNLKNQQHARKFHSYFLVFIKQKSKVDYSVFETANRKAQEL